MYPVTFWLPFTKRSVNHLVGWVGLFLGSIVIFKLIFIEFYLIIKSVDLCLSVSLSVSLSFFLSFFLFPLSLPSHCLGINHDTLEYLMGNHSYQ